mmetsp:Transcript_38574/g.60179  ORF Transcript_38574/g.60179 Transcript_38574/m.60179 type:complete len:343 (+) Transcript_38574:690-1718(+)
MMMENSEDFEDYVQRPTTATKRHKGGGMSSPLSQLGSDTLWDDDPVKLYRHNEHFPGYTGHVPKLCQTFGTRFTIGTRSALSAPPAPSSRPMSSYDPRRGRRVMQTPHLLPGNTFSGFADPTGPTGRGEMATDDEGNFRYLQGSHVDVPSYYKSLKATNYDKLLIKSGFPEKGRSNIEVGDRFYFNGPHMWQTTYRESFLKEAGGGSPKLVFNTTSHVPTPVKQLEIASEPEEKSYHYRVLQAIVGQRRLDNLERSIRNKLLQLTTSGKHEAIQMFKVYDRDSTGYIKSDMFLQISRSLGIHMTSTEAAALFGRYDKNKDDEITFYEFLDEFLGVQLLNPKP